MSPARELMIVILVALGSLMILIAALGVLRMPDLYSRLHAASKAATLGISCLALAMIVHFGEASVVFRAVALGLVVFVTTPISAHLLGRAGFVTWTPLGDDYVVNETAIPPPRDDSGTAEDGGPGEASASGSDARPTARQ